MCLILFAYQQHSDYPLVVAANRDEYHKRPAQAARFWPQQPQLLAGRDLQGGGTWLGVSRNGRFAAVTNFREPGVTTGERSRGELCVDFLCSSQSAAAYAGELSARAGRYGGYNLVLWDGRQLRYYSNQKQISVALQPGVYGISNGYLDDTWPKVVSGKLALQAALAAQVEIERYLDILNDRSLPADHHLPDTGVGLEFERLLAPRFILSDTYGTRVSTALLLKPGSDARFIEQSYDAAGNGCGRVKFEFSVT